MFLQIITDVCVKIAPLEIFVLKSSSWHLHCWYLKEAFAGFCQKIFGKILFQKIG